MSKCCSSSRRRRKTAVIPIVILNVALPALETRAAPRRHHGAVTVYRYGLILGVVLLGACRPAPEIADQGHLGLDETMIRSVRARSNHAIAAHDVVTLADTWLPEYWLVSSTNAQSAGRDAARARFVQLFATRPDVMYVRVPDRIEVNVSWGQAAESGRWTGRWTQADGVTQIGGGYFAKWRKIDGRWLLLAEVFVQTSCAGSSYCSLPP